MWTLIKHEFKTKGSQPVFYIILGIISLLQVLMVTMMIKFFDTITVNSPFLKAPFRVNNAFYLGRSLFFTVIVGAIIGYYIISVEYKNNTWEILLLGTGDKKKILWSKFITSTLYYWGYQVIAYILFLIIQVTYFKLSVDWQFSILVLLSLIFSSLILFTLQLMAHYFISNGTSAIAFAVVLIVLIMLMGRISKFMSYIVVSLTSQYLLVIVQFNAMYFLGIIGLNIFGAIILMLFVSKKFNL